MLCWVVQTAGTTLQLSLNSFSPSRHWKEILLLKGDAAILFFDLSFHIHHHSLLQAAFSALAILAQQVPALTAWVSSRGNNFLYSKRSIWTRNSNSGCRDCEDSKYKCLLVTVSLALKLELFLTLQCTGILHALAHNCMEKMAKIHTKPRPLDQRQPSAQTVIVIWKRSKTFLLHNLM